MPQSIEKTPKPAMPSANTRTVPKRLVSHPVKGTQIAEGFYSSPSMKLSLSDIVIASMTFSDDAAERTQLISMAINFSSMKFEPVR